MKKIKIKNLKNKILEIVVTFISLPLVFSIPFWFIFSNSLIEPLFANILNIRHEPSMAGGPLLQTFYDETDDDNGDGSYEYPYHEIFSEKNLCDIIGYEVYRPLIEPSIWQLAVILKKIPNIYNFESDLSGIQIAIFVDIDSNSNEQIIDINSTNNKKFLKIRGQFDKYEDLNISFPESNKPDFMILIDGAKKEKAKLLFKDGEVNYIDMIIVKEQNKIYIQIPLIYKEIQKILDGRATYHWVFASLSDPLGNNGWINIKDFASVRSGGGLKWEEGPKFYDLLTPSGFLQKDLLSMNNIGPDNYVIIPPLKVSGFDPYISYLKEKGEQKKEKDIIFLNSIFDKVKEEQDLENKLAEEEFNKKLNSDDDLEKLSALFGLSRYDEAKILAEKILKKEKENPVALAYYGSLIAMEGGKTKNPMQAINFVQKAYIYLDKAVEIIEEKLNNNNNQNINDPKIIEYAIIVYTNRAIVSASAPNEIFSKYEVAISDLIKISQLLEKEGKKKESANALMQAAILYEKLNKKTDATAIWLKLINYKEKSAKVELELTKRGFYR